MTDKDPPYETKPMTQPIAAALAAIDGTREGPSMTREEWALSIADADVEARKAERIEMARRDLRSVPREFQWLLHPGWQELLLQRCKLPKEAIKAALRYPRSSNVFIRGASGSGKTSLAVAILRRWIEHGARGHFVSSLYAARDVADAARSARAQAAHMTAIKAPVLLLDDIGFELACAGAGAVCELVGMRRDGFANIWTSAFSDEQLRQHYGDGIRRRLTEARVHIVEIPS